MSSAKIQGLMFRSHFFLSTYHEDITVWLPKLNITPMATSFSTFPQFLYLYHQITAPDG